MLQLDRVLLIAIEHVWIFKLLRCLTWKLRPEKAVASVKRWVITYVFANWTVLTLEETFLSMCRSSGVVTFHFYGKTDISVTFRSPCLCPSEGHKHGVSIQSSINLGDTLLQLTRDWKTAETWFMGEIVYNINHLSVPEWLRFLVLITWQVKTENWLVPGNVKNNRINRPSPSSLVPLFQSESKC